MKQYLTLSDIELNKIESLLTHRSNQIASVNGFLRENAQ